MAQACGGQGRGQVDFAGAGVADQQDVLLLVDVLAARELGDEHLVDRGPGGEVEGLERLDGREPSDLEPALGRSLLTFEQLELGELQQVGEVIGVVGGGLGGHLLALGADRREPQGLQVVVQEHHGLGLSGFMVLLLSSGACAPACWPRGDGNADAGLRCPNMTWETLMR